MRFRRVVASLFLASIGLLTACGGHNDAEETAEISSFINNDPNARWPNFRAVPVCIVNRSEIGPNLYNDLMNLTKREYASRAGIGLVGWQQCTGGDFSRDMIRIYFARIYDWSNPTGAGGGKNMGVGKSSADCGPDCYGGTMLIQIGKSGEYPAGEPWWVLGSTRRAILHEVGHALGLNHEHERTDVRNCQYNTVTMAAQGNNVYVGGYDSESIMNYCKTQYQFNLTNGDVEGLQRLYPGTRDLGGSVSIRSSVSGRCLDLDNFTFDPGVQIQQWDCNGGQRNQLFRLRGVGNGEYEIRSASTDLCLDVGSGSGDDGAPVVQWHCRQSGNQKVRILDRGNGKKSFQFVHSGKCLDVDHARVDNGVKLQQWVCNNTEAQLHAIDHARVDNGVKLQQWVCNNTEAQNFTY